MPEERKRDQVLAVASQAKQGLIRGKEKAIGLFGRFRTKKGPGAIWTSELSKEWERRRLDPTTPVEEIYQGSAAIAYQMFLESLGAAEVEKGQYYTAYGSAGYSISLGVSFDFADLLAIVAPPLALVAKANAGTKGEVGKVKHLLLVIHQAFETKMPKAIINTQQKAEVTFLNIPRPLVFESLYGGETNFGVTLGLEVGISRELSVPFVDLNLDGNALELNLFTGKASLGGKCKLIHLKDEFPAWYPSVLSKELEDDLFRIASPEKRAVKKEIDDFRKQLRDKITGLGYGARKEFITGSTVERLHTHLSTSLLLRFRNLKEPSTPEIVEWLDETATLIAHLQPDPFTSADIQYYSEYIDRIKKTLTDVKIGEKYQKRIHQQVPLKSWYDDHGKPELLDFYKSDLCHTHISVWGLEGEASASSSASASQEFPLPLGKVVPDALAENLSTEISFEAAAETNIRGNIRFMSSRYQTFAGPPVDKTVIFTQDTKITYTQVVWNARAGASANIFNQIEREVGREREKVFKNDMNYYSVTAYWRPLAKLTATLMPGSGLAKGISISSAKLRDLADHLGIDQQAFLKKLKKYHLALSLSISEFTAFLTQIKQEGFLSDSFIAEFPYILLESSFKFVDLGNRVVTRGGKAGRIESLTKKFFKTENNINLRIAGVTQFDSIRCRVRQGNDTDLSESVFKLGIHPPGPKFNIELSKIKRAGNLFIEDVFVYTPAPLPAAPGQVPPEPAVPSVPPVVLLPHTFELE